MKRWLLLLFLVPALLAAQYHTLDDRFTVAGYPSLQVWQQRAHYLREHILASAGLLPMPEKTPLNAVVFEPQQRRDYSVFKVYFESLPGFFVTGNLYKPAGSGPFPAVLSPHGHWAYGRLENTSLASVPGRAINLARMGFVVFTYDMIGYNDSRQLTHRFGGKRENLWGLSLAGLQLWNSIRSVDFLESLPEVDRNRIACTGASGGGTQTFLLAAVDDRVKVAAPVNMISLHMQGGCLCENPPGLRIDTNNVELSACIAPRPLLMVSASGDWTGETMKLEYPEMRKFYALFGAEGRVHALQIRAPHNYNQESREAVYAWMARWLQNAPADVKVTEKEFQTEKLRDLLVFYDRPLPPGAVTSEQLTQNWFSAARRQLIASDPALLQHALRHALAAPDDTSSITVAPPSGSSPGANKSGRAKTVVVLAGDSESGWGRPPALGSAQVRQVRFTPFNRDAASRISHFETYNRSEAAQRVFDIAVEIANARKEGPARLVLIADGEAGPAALLAQAVAQVDAAVINIGRFNNSSDDDFVEKLYIPGLRRAGDFQTAAQASRGRLLVHNAGDSFSLPGIKTEKRALTADEVLKAAGLN
jgi:hypothetical protein